ncbi:hypothetical protein Zmor_008297 [Zophobas morio]|uniref:Odorant receptor n=1 Tax=Zophobas morio TaxID=2755281 RepID=A0AA38MPQ0_9CUCU|nr:hypothetical protein Zmor_008297 [Zophobas morio]
MPANTNSLQGDVLHIVKLVSVDLFQIKVVRQSLNLVLVTLLLVELIQIYMFLQKFDVFFLIQYGSSFTGTIFVLLSTFTIPYSTQLVTKMFDQLKYWDVENGDPKVEEKIRREARRINLYLILYLILVASSAVFNMIPNPDDVAMMHYFMIARTYFPRWENFFFWFFRFSYPMIGLIMMSPYIQTLYCCKCFKFQNLLLLSALEELECKFEDDLILDPMFQREIKNKLIFCVKLHNNIQTGCLKMVKGIKYLIIFFVTTSGWLIICLIFFSIYFQEMLSGKYLRFSTLTSAALILGLYLLYTGQEIEDVTSQTFDVLKNLSWYRWNEENRKIYLMFTIGSQNPLRIEFSENVIVGYSLGAQVAKTVYSVISVLAQLKDFGR